MTCYTRRVNQVSPTWYACECEEPLIPHRQVPRDQNASDSTFRKPLGLPPGLHPLYKFFEGPLERTYITWFQRGTKDASFLRPRLFVASHGSVAVMCSGAEHDGRRGKI